MSAKKQINVRYPPWMIEAVGEAAKRKKTTFSDMVVYLLETKLNNDGYFREDYEPNGADYKKATRETQPMREAK
jgi:macrodomain Ter protein organizer (MatP/YcbG family)